VRFWIGLATLAAGVALLVTTRRERADVPPWTPRLALAVTALGLATLAATRPGLAWSISSISFSLIAIVLLAWVIIDILRR
jgi:hypothetical protein